MKIIHFPGGSGQRCQARYQIGADLSESAGPFGRTVILFVADEKSPGGANANFGDTPDYLLNKVLDQELAGCRFQFIDVFYADLPDAMQRRDVYQWEFSPDLFEPKGDDPSREVSKHYRSVFDRMKESLNIPGAKFELEVRADNPLAGIYPVQVKTFQPKLPEGQRLEILNRFNVLSR